METKRAPMGGQAVMEGVMMMSQDAICMCVRRKDGSITTVAEENTASGKGPKVWKWPIIRGVVNLVRQLKVGYRMIMKSADFMLEDEGEAEENGSGAMGWIAGAAAIVLALGLFFALPSFLAGLVVKPGPWLLVMEGIIRILIFMGYMLIVGLMPDMKRVYMYHGAEHKTLWCYQKGEELTAENAKKYSRLHPMCGTNYLFLVMLVSILIFSLLGVQENLWLRIGIRIVMIPVVAGVAYEVLKLFTNKDHIFAKIVRAPGILLQYLTTREPTDDMLEVAACALTTVLNGEKEHGGL
ncbi:DUF1385 domain-containing protein [Eubacteriales bacterium OttesenSCG-928-M02]|nr:DUF1385 domain-containing protein [Eubacteriales bacterium OttesenSCG-928-M02]